MLSLKVSGMTCGGWINARTKAIQARDPPAKVEADVGTQTITLDTILSAADAGELISAAGFPVLD